MFTPLYLSLIPILNYVTLGRVKGSSINFVYPTIYSIILVLNLLVKGVSSYSLSTIPFIEGHYLPIILVLDYHAVCFLTVLALTYFYIVFTKVYVENPLVLITISASTLLVVSTDYLFSTLMLLVVLTYLNFTNKSKVSLNYVAVTLLSTIIGYLLTNSFNLYFTRYLTGFNYVNVGAASLGLLIYAIPYTLILFTAIGVKPFDQNGGLDVYDKVILTILSVSFLSRLVTLMKNLGGGFIYWIYVLFTAPILIANYIVNYVDYGKLDKLLKFGELHLTPILSTLLTPLTYLSLVTTLSSTITHLLVNDVLKDENAVKVSKTLLPASPSFVTYLTVIYSLLNSLPSGLNVALTITILFPLLVFVNNIYTYSKVVLGRNSILLNVTLGLTLGIYVYLYVSKAGEQLFNLTLYLRLIGL